MRTNIILKIAYSLLGIILMLFAAQNILSVLNLKTETKIESLRFEEAALYAQEAVDSFSSSLEDDIILNISLKEFLQDDLMLDDYRNAKIANNLFISLTVNTVSGDLPPNSYWENLLNQFRASLNETPLSQRVHNTYLEVKDDSGRLRAVCGTEYKYLSKRRSYRKSPLLLIRPQEEAAAQETLYQYCRQLSKTYYLRPNRLDSKYSAIWLRRFGNENDVLIINLRIPANPTTVAERDLLLEELPSIMAGIKELVTDDATFLQYREAKQLQQCAITIEIPWNHSQILNENLSL